MYQPSAFMQEHKGSLLACIRDYPLATLICTGDFGVEVNHLPLQLFTENGTITLQGHIAKQNTLWEIAEHITSTLAVFQGPNAYISPSWYPSKTENPKVVPTWNYIAVHVNGTPTFHHERDWKLAHLKTLTEHHERHHEPSWEIADAPADFTDKLLEVIVGFEINVTKVSGKFKLSQNQTLANRKGIRANLERSTHAMDKALAAFIYCDH